MKPIHFSLRTVLLAAALLLLIPGVTVLAQEIITSAEPGYVSPEAAFAPNPADPDYIDPTLNAADPNVTYYYTFVAGSTLRPRNSTADWHIDSNGGCLYTNALNEIFNVDLQLPNGATIEYLRLYYYDTSASDNRAWVTSYDGAGNYNDLITVASTGDTGYGNTLSSSPSVVVDTLSNSYLLNWRSYTAGNTSQLCGLRVFYSTNP